jgi:hypothetical protein
MWACGTHSVPENHLVSCKYLSPRRGAGLHFSFLGEVNGFVGVG